MLIFKKKIFDPFDGLLDDYTKDNSCNGLVLPVQLVINPVRLNVLIEIERDIYLGMEALENAFGALHGKAEIV